MDFSKSIYSRGGARRSRAQPRPGFASPRSRHPRHHSLTFAPALRCAHPSVHARLPHPGCAPLRPASPRTPFARLLRSPLALVPRSVYPLACAPLLWARRETREGWGTARRGLGWAHRPSYPRGYAGVAGCVKAGGGGGRADPPPCVRGRLAGVARAEEDWAVRAVPPLARVGGAGRAVRPLAYAGRAGRGLGWRGPRGGGGAPSLLSLCGRGGAGRGGARGAGQASPAPKGTGVGRGRGDVPSCAPFPRERGGADRGAATCPPSAQTRRLGGREGPAGGGPARTWWVGQTRGKGPRAPHLRANGAAAVNAEGGRGRRGQGAAPVSSLSACERAGALRPLFDASGVGEGRGAGGEERRGEERREVGWASYALCTVQSLQAEARRACHNWVCERRTPTPPPTPPSSPLLSSPLLSSRSPPLAYPTRVEKWTQRAGPFARREGAHGSRPLSAPPYSRETGAHEDEGRAGPSPVSDRPTTFARARRPPAPPFPPTALSARKEDTSPLPCPRRPVSRGKGAHEGTSPRPLPARARRTAYPPQSPSAQATPAQPHAPRPAPPRPARIARGGTRTDGASSPAHARKGRDGAHSPVLLGAGHASQPPAHARGRVGASTPSSGFYAPRHARVPPGIRGSVRPASPLRAVPPSPPGFSRRAQRRGAWPGEGPKHAAREGYTERGAERERRAEESRGRVSLREVGAERERTRVGEAAHERKGGLTFRSAVAKVRE
ncbi:hypothetical protein EDB84DRAFT_1680700 [Lactarius hengduanensis]|nr:hypothetical protein EDB84DRAFT_1680700 [Lactarius hengduanensis]